MGIESSLKHFQTSTNTSILQESSVFSKSVGMRVWHAILIRTHNTKHKEPKHDNILSLCKHANTKKIHDIPLKKSPLKGQSITIILKID